MYLRVHGMSSFNRRGDSLGGATLGSGAIAARNILFQSQRRFFGGSNVAQSGGGASDVTVSIAEAILWGEQLRPFLTARL